MNSEKFTTKLNNMPDVPEERFSDYFNRLKSCLQICIDLNSDDSGRDYKNKEVLISEIERKLHPIADPDYCTAYNDENIGGLLSACAFLFTSLPGEILRGREYRLNQYLEFLENLMKKMVKSEDSGKVVREVFVQFKLELYFQPDMISWEEEISAQYLDEGFGLILTKILEASDSMALILYGRTVSEEERQLFDFLKKYPKQKLDALGERIADAFLHGFVSQSRQRAGRNRVRLQYNPGQEIIAGAVVESCRMRGLKVHILPPVRLAGGQLEWDHRFDGHIYVDSQDYKSCVPFYELALRANEKRVKQFCGTIIIDQFSRFRQPVNKGKAVALSNNAIEILRAETEQKKTLLKDIQPPGSLSFCKLVFPGIDTPGDFKSLFETFMEINISESEPWEQMQQIIINTLDRGVEAHVSGCKGNRTDMKIKLAALEEPQHHTNFQNCGGDLNIPFGEVFTTPVLRGTGGLLHFKEISLKGISYKELKLHFKDGCITDFSCMNYKDTDFNRRYIRENLLADNDSLPLGEFAIGTNTQAYSLLNRSELLEILPILILEKLGPHFAIGDPCWAGAEDEHVFNLIDGKKITAKENERTRLRNSNPKLAYTNLHIDMTLPYNEVGLLSVTDGNGRVYEIIRNGEFKLPGLEEMNKYLRSKKENEF